MTSVSLLMGRLATEPEWRLTTAALKRLVAREPGSGLTAWRSV